MFKELNEFYEVVAKHDKRIEDARAELATAQGTHQEAYQAYRKMVEEETSGTKIHSAAKIGAAKRAADDEAQIIEIAKERLERFESAKQAELKELAKTVKAGYQREFQVIRDGIDAIIEESKPLAGSLLQLAVKASDHRMKAIRMAQELGSVEDMVGVENPYYQRHLSNLPNFLSFVDTSELDKTYQTGELPSWAKELDSQLTQ
ncbi:hypothetical protein [Paenibacillus sp. GM2]|uniref:hypothetical protein n=1 Tax=Paenibacillus sp. GM2 TaxID=1622070 RepID=UPI0008387433|nr:hypothetical protein [Paenibacillus sp. GM2]